MKIIAYDLGTGGIKASLFDANGISLADSFIQYDTFYPDSKWHEQKPIDWWNGVCRSTKILLEKSASDPKEIACIALSGHSLIAVPLDKNGNLLTEYVPIWSDTRASDCVKDFFSSLLYEDWYMTTGNGDPPECYSIIKLMWMKRHQPDIFKKIDKILGSKDFINYKLTGVQYTDPSYASGFGVFNLLKWDYEDRFFEAAGIKKKIFTEILPTDSVIGNVTYEAAIATGLAEGTPVACGAVDNTCMALGARGIGEGRVYTSLGSSSWIAVTSQKPVLDVKTRPFVFAHAQKGYYTSAVSIFSAGNSFRWVRDNICKDIVDDDIYDKMNEMVRNVSLGSNGILFNPTLAGGSAQEISPNMRGAFFGLSLANTREDMVHAAMEGITMALKEVLDILLSSIELEKEMLICGGGSKSIVWRKIFADIFDKDIVKTNIDQDAATLGAAAIAAKAVGIWADYKNIDRIHKVESIEKPVQENVRKYKVLLDIFRKLTIPIAELGDKMQLLHEKGIW